MGNSYQNQSQKDNIKSATTTNNITAQIVLKKLNRVTVIGKGGFGKVFTSLTHRYGKYKSVKRVNSTP
jgi:hypothetical protein